MRNRTRNSGFTLIETLAAVAIVVILLGVSAVAVVRYIDVLKITELDNAAREIFMAAENRAVLLSSSRRLDDLVDTSVAAGNGARVENTLRSALVAHRDDEKSYYVYNIADTDLDSDGLLTYGSIDPALLNGNFYIVYDLESGSVTDVFYAEDPLDLEDLVAGLRGAGDTNFERFYSLWADTRSNRLDLKRTGNKPLVGWYNSEAAQGGNFVDTSKEPYIHVQIINDEKLTVTVWYTYTAPDFSSAAELEVLLGDTVLSKPLKLTDVTENGRIMEEYPEAVLLNAGGDAYTHAYSCIWVLDSLTGDGSNEGGPLRFKDLGLDSFTYGSDFKVVATLTPHEGTSLKAASDEDENNSLFQEGSGGTTAYIKYLRHLQNLNADYVYASGVTGKTSAEQTDVIFGGGYNNIYEGYNFVPIKNDSIETYDGWNREIRNLNVNYSNYSQNGSSYDYVASGGAVAAPAGLFMKATAVTLKNIRMVNTTVSADGESVGALAGEVLGGEINNCWVYWEPDEDGTDLTGVLGSNADGSGYTYQLQGAAVGGLVGILEDNTVWDGDTETKTGTRIENCLAATLINGTQNAGGLVGLVEGSGPTITNSYADCYLTGTGNVAGLVGGVESDVGTTAIKLTNCYAAGFILGGTKTAGLCLGGGTTTAENVYSVMRLPAGEDTFSLTEKQDTDTFVNTHFLGSGTESINGAQGHIYASMISQSFVTKMGTDQFVKQWKASGASNPYNLRDGLFLTDYDYPGLKNLPHYGDWAAQFKGLALVYYEEYKGNTNAGGFGGNITALRDDQTVLLDGYAVAFTEEDLKGSTQVKFKCTYFDEKGNPQSSGSWTTNGWNKNSYFTPAGWDADGNGWVTIPVSDLIKTTWRVDGTYKVFYLIPLPDELVLNYDATDSFYRYLEYELILGEDETLDISVDESYFNPHFAKAVESYTGEDETGERTWEAVRKNAPTPDYISVRTPRHLYDLSQYKAYWNNGSSFVQELDLDYALYTGYGLIAGVSWDAPFQQQPIGRRYENETEVTSFAGTYNGGCNVIKNVVPLVSDAAVQRQYAGLFGKSEGTLRNIVYEMNPGYQVVAALSVDSAYDRSVYFGALAGASSGLIENCAVSGANLHVDISGMALYEGGLVGQNTGMIRASAAQSAMLSANCLNYTDAYVSGFVGENATANASITYSYAVGRINVELDDTTRTARICGFVGWNSGNINYSYAAMDLQYSGGGESGVAEIYGFCGYKAGNQGNHTYYLDRGNFTYLEGSYNAKYERDGDIAHSTQYDKLSNKEREDSPVSGMTWAEVTWTETEDGTEVSDELYPYPTAVKDKNGKPVHYGDWPAPMSLGEMGVFYWEKLVVNGDEENATYHIYALAVDPTKGTITRQSTLLTAHDDGSVITEYGYGYYNDTNVDTGFKANNIAYVSSKTDVAGVLSETGGYLTGHEMIFTDSGAPNYYLTSVKKKLEEQMPGFKFWPWDSYHEIMDGRGTVVKGLVPVNTNASSWSELDLMTCTFALSQRDEKTGKTAEVEFVINPHFAASMSVKSAAVNDTENLDISGFDIAPGEKGNSFQVRCGWQLQNINWHDINVTSGAIGFERVVYDVNGEPVLVKREGYKNVYETEQTIYSEAKHFPYLSGIKEYGRSGETNHSYYWEQTHDVDWTAEGNVSGGGNAGIFYAISQSYISYQNNYGQLLGWFSGHYEGGNYTMKNLNIGVDLDSDIEVNAMGLFGVIKDGATLNNIVLYSESGKDKVTVKGRYMTKFRWYAGGVLVGVCKGGHITNCAVAGYTLIDDTRDLGAQGSAIGGLVGAADTELKGCAAVVNIQVLRSDFYSATEDLTSATVLYQGPLRVGGLAGTTIGDVTNCYTGGSITVDKKASFHGVQDDGSLCIGRITGGTGMEMFSGTGFVYIAIENCYSYMTLPDKDELLSLGGLGRNENKNESWAAGTYDHVLDYVNVYNIGGCDNLYRGGDGSVLAFVDHITNCYYLEGTGVGKDRTYYDLMDADYGGYWFEAFPEWFTESESATYRQLAGKESLAEGENLVEGVNDIYAALGSAYNPVTAEISGLNAGGRYSKVPQTYQYLQGMDYPFPTVLTQPRSGMILNVHYGEWPLNGIVRTNGGKPVELDMFTGLIEVPVGEETKTVDWEPGHYEETLALTEDVQNTVGTWSVESKNANVVTARFKNADGQPVDELTNSTGNYNEVTLVITAHAASDIPVTVTVKYTADGIEYPPMPITVNVNANTRLRPDSVRIFPSDTVTVPLETYGTRPGEKLYDVPLTTGRLDIDKDGLTITEGGSLVENAPFAAEMTETDDTAVMLSRGNEGTTGAKFAVNVPYDYTQDGYKVEGRADNIAVELLALPASLWEKVKTDSETGETGQWTWTIDFSGYRPSGFAVTAPEDPEGFTVTGDDSGRITLTLTDEDRFPEDGVELTVELTMDDYGLKHTLTITVPKPETGELKPSVKWSNEEPGVWTVDFSAYEPDRIEVIAPEAAEVSEDGQSVIITLDEGSAYPESVSLTVILTKGGLRQQYELTVAIPDVQGGRWDENGNSWTADIGWENAEINAVKVWAKEGEAEFIEAASWSSAETAALEDDGSEDETPEDSWKVEVTDGKITLTKPENFEGEIKLAVTLTTDGGKEYTLTLVFKSPVKDTEPDTDTGTEYTLAFVESPVKDEEPDTDIGTDMETGMEAPDQATADPDALGGGEQLSQPIDPDPVESEPKELDQAEIEIPEPKEPEDQTENHVPEQTAALPPKQKDPEYSEADGPDPEPEEGPEP